MNYILSMNPDLEAKDVKGFTPLHIAIPSVEKLESTRMVKALLIRGANRNATSNQGKTPLDLIPTLLPDRLQEELRQNLSQTSYCECLMIRVPLVPLRPNHRTQILFLSLFLVIYVLNMITILPTLEPHNLYYQLFSTISTIVVLIGFTWASFKDPGVLKPSKDYTFLELLRDINPADLCPECKVIRSARSRHCAICNHCVERFDHHCPWINNCVGIKNHNAFLFFLVSIWVKIVFHLGADILVLVRLIKNDGATCETDECNFYCYYCTHYSIKMTASILSISICLFYFLLSTLLLNVHIRNYMANRTTHERFAKRKPVKIDSDSEEDPEESSSIMETSDFEKSSI
jgi:palmitoyltransferase